LAYIEHKQNQNKEMPTALKREGQPNLNFYSQVTPRPYKRILLFDEHKEKHLFPLMRDREVGITSKYQNIVIQSVNMLLLSTTMTTNGPPVPRCREA
jgi:hypothetical protein